MTESKGQARSGEHTPTPVKIGDPFFPVAWQVSERIKRYGGVRAAARVLAVDPAYLSRLRDGKKRDPGPRLLKKLGLKAEVRYVYV